MRLDEEQQEYIDRFCFVLRNEQEVWIAVLVEGIYYLIDTKEFIADPDDICPGDEAQRNAWLARPFRCRLVIKRDSE